MLDVSQRFAGSRQLTAADAARRRDLTHVLGGIDHWNPTKYCEAATRTSVRRPGRTRVRAEAPHYLERLKPTSP
jgi:hypothetical protein